VTRAVLPAILLEAAFYLAAGFESTRDWLRKRFSPPRLALLMTVSAVLPYCAYSLPTGHFQIKSLLCIAALAAIASYWFLMFGISAAADWGFLVLLAAPVIAKTFNWLYPEPFPKVATSVILGFTMWIHIGILTILAIRRMEGIGFGFLPTWREWRIGVLCYALFLPVGLLLEWKLQVVGLHAPNLSWTRAAIVAGTFVAFLWVAGLAEEFFFRGLLQTMLARVAGPTVGLLIASAIFGAAHLGFRDFPNWRFSILAGVAGLFYGRAFSQARSIRASMVTHALVVATWRLFSG
jgi:membrane protease YdiL (CAAX protease family)